MANFVEYNSKDAIDLAQLINKRKITEVDCFNAAVKRIEAVNSQLNAVIYTMYDEAKRELRKGLPRGDLFGVPFLIKDLLDAYNGVPMTNGSRAFKRYVPDYDSETVVRYKQSGLNIIGKTNCPEFGLLGITEPELHGPTRNPWDISRTPGGSSGGSAAAVAVGMVPAASAGDGGGSIRIPASHCGIFGLKPTRGRTPTGPRNGRIWQGATSLGVLSRSVRDSAKLLDILSGEEAGSPYGINANTKSFFSECRKKCRSLKIAVNTDSPIGTEVDRDCKSAVKETVKILERLGHTVEYTKPEIDGMALARSYFIVYTADVAETIRSSAEITGKNPSINDFELLTWILGLLGQAFSAADLQWAINLWDKTARIMGEFHKKYDLYLTPTVAALPAKIGVFELKPFEKMFLSTVGKFGLGTFIKKSGIIEEAARTIMAKTPFTQLANFTGQPAMSVPLFWNQDNLPLGSQFIAPFGDEATLFNLAGQLEKAAPWKERRPNL